jgi:hypothetical protein
MEELLYNLEVVKRAIASEMERVQKHITSLQKDIEQGNTEHTSDWVEGFVGRDVARMTALLSQQQALYTAIHIAKKNQ